MEDEPLLSICPCVPPALEDASALEQARFQDRQDAVFAAMQGGQAHAPNVETFAAGLRAEKDTPPVWLTMPDAPKAPLEAWRAGRALGREYPAHANEMCHAARAGADSAPPPGTCR